MNRKNVLLILLGILMIIFRDIVGCDLSDFKNHTINYENYLILRKEIIEGQYLNKSISADCLSEILYCVEFFNDRQLANAISKFLLKNGKDFWGRMFEIIVYNIDERGGLLESIEIEDIPSDEDHIKVIFHFCDLREILKIKNSRCKKLLLPYYEGYLKIISNAKKFISTSCKDCPKGLADYHYCDSIETNLYLNNYYENAYLFVKENEKSCYSTMGNFSVSTFKNRMLLNSLNSWHRKEASKFWEELKKKLEEKDYNTRGFLSIESSFLIASVFLGKEIMFDDDLTEYSVEGLKFPVVITHREMVKRQKENYEIQVKIQKQLDNN